MDNYFNKYKESKLCLYHLLMQVFDYYILKEKAKELNIEYEEDNNFSSYVSTCFHNYNSDGLLAWELLELDNRIYSFNEIWDKEINLRKEQEKDINYYEKYLRISILVLEITLNYYSREMDLAEVEKLNTKYNDIDEFEGKVEICDHRFESAGEKVWNFFDVEDPFVGKSILYYIQRDLKEELFNIDCKVKRIGEKNEN